MSSTIYNNNPLLKKHDAKVSYTPEQVDEIAKCFNDITYFFSNYVYIINLDKGRILFEPYDYQIEMINVFHENRFSICKTSRQLGKTITVAAYLLWNAIFNRDYTIGILANISSKAQEILSRIKMMYEELPYWLKPGVLKWNERSVKFSNGSIIFSSSTTPSSIRGYSLNMIYMDEFAFVQNDVRFYESTYPVIASGKTTKIIITSTPLGLNLFYKLWTDAVNERNSYKPIEVLWWRHPDRDETWKRQTILDTSQAQFDQEHNCRFLGSSDTLVSGDCLEKLVYSNPIEESDCIKVYAKPIEDHTYVMCVDVSEGTGKDYSTIVVIDVTNKPYDQVFVYRRNDLSPWHLSGIVYNVGKTYNDAHALVENNSIGKIVADSLFHEYDYENMISTKLKADDRVDGYSWKSVGLQMNRKTKMIGCTAIKALIEDNYLLLHDWNTIQELSCFVKVGTSYQAEKGKNDDLVMPLVHFGWLTTQAFFEDITQQGLQELVRERREKEAEMSHLAFGFKNDGTESDCEVDPSFFG